MHDSNSSFPSAGEIPHTFTAGELTICVRGRRVRPDPYATPQRPGQHPRHPYTLAPAAHRTLGNVAVLTASATRSDLPPAVLHVQLELLHLQLLAWTSAKYERVLMDNPALDTSAALAGTEASFEALVKRLDFAMDYVLQAVETLRMRPIVRGAAEAALQQVRPLTVCGCSLRHGRASSWSAAHRPLWRTEEPAIRSEIRTPPEGTKSVQWAMSVLSLHRRVVALQLPRHQHVSVERAPAHVGCGQQSC